MGRGVTWPVMLLVASIAGTSQAADRWQLSEATQKGDLSRIRIEMKLEGHLLLRSGDKTTQLPLQATARHDFVERVVDVDQQGRPTQTVRHYDTARATITVHGVPRPRELRPERKLQVVQTLRKRTVSYSPQGPMSREEEELIGQHFNTLALGGVFPEKEVGLGESWRLAPYAVQGLCGLDALVSHEVQGTLKSVQNNQATVRITGTVEGITAGAEVRLDVSGKLSFDLQQKRWTSVEWNQKEQRTQGPVSPASKTETTIHVQRDFPEKADALSDEIVSGLPATPDEAALHLVFREPKGRWEFLYDRNWHLVTQTDQYAVLRLIEDGELLGQLNITYLPRAKRGEHISVEELQKLVREAPGFRIEQVIQSGEVPAEKGCWIYRLSVVGRADDLPIVQNVYAIAGPDGDQVLMAFTTEVSQVERFGVRDLAIVGSVTFKPAK
ncbi:MAG: hypothetical protein NZM31_01720 [Gemmatales bacterium]|nr:hypothetical protein [Gemmatales bacterium]MDW8385716.1 hypothetical protein [Gemmatales bacterium]